VCLMEGNKAVDIDVAKSITVSRSRGTDDRAGDAN
jgi:hypothetical protein